MPPPPPPPMVDEDMMESDSEALYSMLIAWYMSGYHTGYYQVRKNNCTKLLNPNIYTTVEQIILKVPHCPLISSAAEL